MNDTTKGMEGATMDGATIQGEGAETMEPATMGMDGTAAAEGIQGAQAMDGEGVEPATADAMPTTMGMDRTADAPAAETMDGGPAMPATSKPMDGEGIQADAETMEGQATGPAHPHGKGGAPSAATTSRAMDGEPADAPQAMEGERKPRRHVVWVDAAPWGYTWADMDAAERVAAVAEGIAARAWRPAPAPTASATTGAEGTDADALGAELARAAVMGRTDVATIAGAARAVLALVPWDDESPWALGELAGLGRGVTLAAYDGRCPQDVDASTRAAMLAQAARNVLAGAPRVADALGMEGADPRDLMDAAGEWAASVDGLGEGVTQYDATAAVAAVWAVRGWPRPGGAGDMADVFTGAPLAGLDTVAWGPAPAPGMEGAERKRRHLANLDALGAVAHDVRRTINPLGSTLADLARALGGGDAAWAMGRDMADAMGGGLDGAAAALEVARGAGRYGLGGGTETPQVRTMFPTIDAALGGGMRAGLLGIAAGPGTGKTALLCEWAILAALGRSTVTGEPAAVIYVVDEVSPSQVAHRMAAMVDATGEGEGIAWADLGAILADPTGGDRARVLAAMRAVSRVAAHVVELGQGQAPQPGQVGIMAAADATRCKLAGIMERMGSGPRLIVVDPANALAGTWADPDAPGDRRSQIDAVAHGLDELGRHYGVPVASAWHVSQTNVARRPSAPGLADFKESSDIGHMLAVAMELVRARDMGWDAHPKAPAVPAGAEPVALYLLKNRHGACDPSAPAWLSMDYRHNLAWELGDAAEGMAGE